MQCLENKATGGLLSGSTRKKNGRFHFCSVRNRTPFQLPKQQWADAGKKKARTGRSPGEIEIVKLPQSHAVTICRTVAVAAGAQALGW